MLHKVSNSEKMWCVSLGENWREVLTSLPRRKDVRQQKQTKRHRQLLSFLPNLPLSAKKNNLTPFKVIQCHWFRHQSKVRLKLTVFLWSTSRWLFRRLVERRCLQSPGKGTPQLCNAKFCIKYFLSYKQFQHLILGNLFTFLIRSLRQDHLLC